MDEMIERLARVGYEAMIKRGPPEIIPADHGWDIQSEGLKDDWRACVREQLAALREPTDAMRGAGAKASDDISFHMSSFHCAGESWKAMTDETLK